MKQKYDVLYVDPPWQYNLRRNAKTKFGAGMSRYAGMTLDELKALPVNKIANKNAALFLWTTNAAMKRAHPAHCSLRYMFELAEAWHFYYATKAFCWVKLDQHGAPRLLPGYYTGSNTEDCYLLVRGTMPPVDKGVNQIVYSVLGEHSRKPDEVRARIERLYPTARRIELFARDYYPGWVSWGNETVNCSLEDALKLRAHTKEAVPTTRQQVTLF